MNELSPLLCQILLKIKYGEAMNLSKIISIFTIVIVSFLSVTACASEPSSNNIENFTLPDYNGAEHSLSDYKDSKAIVIIFIATECPVSNAYNSRMEDLYKEYNPKDIAFLGINSNKAESIEMIKEHAEENGLTFTILKDKNNVVADEFEASFTPEVYVLNSDFNILYHGRIDNSKNKDDVTTKDLENALNEILAGKEVTTKATKAFGCSIKRV
jgi:peroxiredoxin